MKTMKVKKEVKPRTRTSELSKTDTNVVANANDKRLERLRTELAAHGKTCDCAHKKMCEDREEGLMVELGLLPLPPQDDQLERIAKELDAASVPQEVWIGTDSTADRVTWLITRNKLNQQNSRSRHKAIEVLANCIESAMLGKLQLGEAREALVLAGRRKPKQHAG